MLQSPILLPCMLYYGNGRQNIPAGVFFFLCFVFGLPLIHTTSRNEGIEGHLRGTGGFSSLLEMMGSIRVHATSSKAQGTLQK